MNAKHSSKSVEHYSPPFIVEAARSVLGRIDLDPASCELANQTVRAERIFTREDDGLARQWFGRVFLNPPGGKDGNESVQKAWWFKLAHEWAQGRVDAAIFVGFSIEILQTTQNEPKGLLPLNFPFCVPRARIPFDRPVDPEEDRPQAPLFAPTFSGESRGVESGDQPPHANVIVLLPTRGPDASRMHQAFTEYFWFRGVGRVVDTWAQLSEKGGM